MINPEIVVTAWRNGPKELPGRLLNNWAAYSGFAISFLRRVFVFSWFDFQNQGLIHFIVIMTKGKHNVVSPFKIATSKNLKSDFTTGHITSRFRTPSSTHPLPPSMIHPRWNRPPVRYHPRVTLLSWCSIEKMRAS